MQAPIKQLLTIYQSVHITYFNFDAGLDWEWAVSPDSK